MSCLCWVRSFAFSLIIWWLPKNAVWWIDILIIICLKPVGSWALCYRKYLLVRGNQTIMLRQGCEVWRILYSVESKHAISYRCLVLSQCLELYYRRKILSVAHNRFEHHISLKFQGIKCSGISESQIQQLDEPMVHLMNSHSECGVKYQVDIKLRVCSCNAGQDGFPCSHQAAIVKYFHTPSVHLQC